MIQALANRFKTQIAAGLLLLFYFQFVLPLFAVAETETTPLFYSSSSKRYNTPAQETNGHLEPKRIAAPGTSSVAHANKKENNHTKLDHIDIGGPAKPEASSFKAAGADNLVNLFTGDFSYSVPLLDLDGYPVNLFYNGGISMEQEASWVGLGWNINPGSVSRTMRGVPDDFDGTEQITQTQGVKPNKTWGGEVGVDGEFLGIKTPNLNFNLGYSYNNYLGPEIETGVGVSVSIPITKTTVHEKTAPQDTVQGLNLSLGLNAKLSSRSGMTLSPSLNAGLHLVSQHTNIGLGISTSYNSRTGIKDLNISSQASSYMTYLKKDDKGNVVSAIGHSGFPMDLGSTTITFARPSYVPTIRMPMQSAYYSGQVELGGGMFGARGAITAQGYYTESKIAEGANVVKKPLVGFMYLENANGRKDAVMDFNRLNDGEVTPNTPVISAPQYSYDVFAIQGEGTGGMIRAYRSDIGFMRDPEVNSKDKNISLGFDIAPPGHYGGNVNIISAPTRAGSWDDANNTLNQTLVFKGKQSNSSFENVYFRNPGEATVVNDNMINKIGGDNLVRFKIDGSNVSPRLEPQLEQFSKKTTSPLNAMLPVATANSSLQKDKRTQVITMLNAGDAQNIGLDPMIKSYLPTLSTSHNLQYNSIPRVGDYRKSNHISEISVLEGSGMRYVYGIPVYSLLERDYTFSVGAAGDQVSNIVNFTGDETTTGSPHIASNSKTNIDGYVNIQEMPAYASSFLLTGLLSPDYVDVTGDGISEDDLGTAVKFNYSKQDDVHRWRTPRNNTTPNTAHFNAGQKTEKRDNKASISYGEREAWYLHSIESKSMIAIFRTSARTDSKGVNSDLDGRVNSSENANLKLDSIMLFSKSDLKTNGFEGAKPLKTVHFEYSYTLCNGSPDNASGGKLTLNDIYTTYNGQPRALKKMYVFNYGTATAKYDNPSYDYNASDRWGTYKPVKDSTNNAVNPNGLNNVDYPYTSTNKAADDQFAGAWSLKKILLPSGGQIEVQYEADDYAYVQNRRACNMFNIYGFGTTNAYTNTNQLYTIANTEDRNFVYIQLPTALTGKDAAACKREIYAKYLSSLNQLAFKLNVYMPKGVEPLTVYAEYLDYGICSNSTDNKTIFIQLKPVDGKGPLSNSVIHYLIDNLPGQAFPGYDMSEDVGISAFLNLIGAELSGYANAFKNAEQQMRSAGKASMVALASSFVRLASPSFVKYGGGHRVKRVLLKDNWNALSGQYTSQYGQDYDYTTTTMVNGVATQISSGVASYEPGIGSEENPFREILMFENKLPLASAQYGAIEMPALEAFFPAPLVGYSKVTVRSINRNSTKGATVRSSVGKQVTEFYTARDYPSFCTYTPMNTMDYHHNPHFTFFNKETVDRRTTSQGFLVETNDMHGKMKSQASYSESDPNTAISYTLHTYKNTGVNGLNDKVDFVYNNQNGAVAVGNLGVDMELMTDVREFSVLSNGLNVQTQLDFFTFAPFPIFGIFFWPLKSYTENKYRAVTTTKLINYHAIEDSVIVMDKGSTVSTKNILFDAETGSVVSTKTNNEFNQPIYSTSYPAYWAYSGMGPAYKNINDFYTGLTFSNGRIVAPAGFDQSIFESGDELYVTAQSNPALGCDASLSSADAKLIWAFDTVKNSSSLAHTPYFVFLDAAGNTFTKTGVTFRIVRSGKRNLLNDKLQAVTSLSSPIKINGSVRTLSNTSDAQMLNISAIEYREKWQTDKDVIKTYSTLYSSTSCSSYESPDCNGDHLEKTINPYRKGLVGTFRVYRNMVFYGDRSEVDPLVNTNILKNGFLASAAPYWDFNASGSLMPATTNAKWLWNTRSTRFNARGLELETQDALGVYSAAQYGYQKVLPVAVANNAAYSESVFDGLEDYNYSSFLNNSTYIDCPNARYIDLSSIAQITSSDNLGFAAHSGKYVLSVGPTTTANKVFNVKQSPVEDFVFQYKTDTTKTLINEGVTFAPTDPSLFTPKSNLTYPSNLLSYSQGYFQFDGGTNWGLKDTSTCPTCKVCRYDFTTTHYINITTLGQYPIGVTVSSNPWPNDIAIINVKIYTLDNAVIYGTSASTGSGTPRSLSDNVCLSPGIYKIQCSVNGNGSVGTSQTTLEQFTFSIGSLKFYKESTTQNGCIYTVPPPGDQLMLHPIFTPTAGKKMFFSAWVRETCTGGTGQCPPSNYTKSSVKMQFSTGTNYTFIPAGSVVDGWQKVEGTFDVPPSASTMTLSFVNADNSNPIYFDDIRIHPFNSNMKSYVYDPTTLRLSAELDENNFATFYDYDEEGKLIRTKKETQQGIKTIQETRSATQKAIQTIQ